MTRVAVVAPAAFGEAASSYLAGAAEALACSPARCALVDGPDDLEQALAPLADGDVVLGSLGSELAAAVARAAADRGLLHVEAGAIGDEAVGPRSYRLTAAKPELAEAAAALAAGGRVGLVVEPSVFGRTMREAVAAGLAARGIEVVVDAVVDDVLADPSGWQGRHRVDVVVAALRGGLPGRLLAVLGGVERVVGAGGSWTGPEVGRAAARTRGCRLVFCEVMAPRANRPRAGSRGHALYGDLGAAAGEIVARVLAARRPAEEALAQLVVDADDSPLGYGVRFGAGGRNELARAALLQWENGAIVSYEPGGQA
jgi:ABC-type branched-subunit amino acid transport system substrate-binding protein